MKSRNATFRTTEEISTKRCYCSTNCNSVGKKMGTISNEILQMGKRWVKQAPQMINCSNSFCLFTQRILFPLNLIQCFKFRDDNFLSNQENFQIHFSQLLIDSVFFHTYGGQQRMCIAPHKSVKIQNQLGAEKSGSEIDPY